MLALKKDRSPFAALRYRPSPADTDRLQALADAIGLSGDINRMAGELSQGQKQRLEIGKPSADHLAKSGMAVVPQGREIFPLLTVRENLETGFACLQRADRRVPDEIFELFPVLKEMETRRGGDLSVGQQQQLAIGRALITRPKLLLLDEPTEGIQPDIIQKIDRVIAYLRDQ